MQVMTKDQIMRMARKAGMPDPMVFIGAYERFSALLEARAAAAEREACAKVCESYSDDEWLMLQQDDCAAAIRARVQV